MWPTEATETCETDRSVVDRIVVNCRAKVSCTICSARAWSRLNLLGRRKSNGCGPDLRRLRPAGPGTGAGRPGGGAAELARAPEVERLRAGLAPLAAGRARYGGRSRAEGVRGCHTVCIG